MLYLVATPIGNMADITLRAIETLRLVDVVASEDTRRTGRLLKYHAIETPQLPFHEHNERAATARLLGLLARGKSIALVTDAGTPGISDPGFVLVRSVVEAGQEVTVLPGATAFVPALILSGLATHGFTFRGFPPRKRGARRRFLALDLESPHTLIFYESPYRIDGLLTDALEVYGDRDAALARELTKKFETVERGRIGQLRAALPARPKGEYVFLVAGVQNA